MKPTPTPIPEGFHSVTPQLVCRNALQALEFYKNAFGAEIISVGKDDKGTVMHAEIKIGYSIVMLSDEFPSFHCFSPLSTGGGTSVTLHIYTRDADAAFAQAVAAGANITMPLMDAFWGDRYGQVAVPFGPKWSIATRQRLLTEEEVQTEMQKAMAQMEKGKPANA